MIDIKRPKANALGLLQELVMKVSVAYGNMLPFNLKACNILDSFLLTRNKS